MAKLKPSVWSFFFCLQTLFQSADDTGTIRDPDDGWDLQGFEASNMEIKAYDQATDQLHFWAGNAIFLMSQKWFRRHIWWRGEDQEFSITVHLAKIWRLQDPGYCKVGDYLQSISSKDVSMVLLLNKYTIISAKPWQYKCNNRHGCNTSIPSSIWFA